MRNQFYPKKMAEYVTKEQLKQLGLDHTQLERDPTFGISQPQAALEPEPEKIERAVEIHADLLKVVSVLNPEDQGHANQV